MASAVTNTYLAVTSALATAKELFPGQRFIEAGLAGAAGAVQVAKISKTQFEGGGTPAQKSVARRLISAGGKMALSMLNPRELIRLTPISAIEVANDNI